MNPRSFISVTPDQFAQFFECHPELIAHFSDINGFTFYTSFGKMVAIATIDSSLVRRDLIGETTQQ